MKIVYVITKSNWGGAQRYVHDMALFAQQKKHEVTVAFGGDGLLAKRLRDAHIETSEIPSLVNNFGISGSIKALREIFTLLDKKRPDLVHVNSSKAAVLGVIAARLAGVKKIIFTLHGWPFDSTGSKMKQLLLALPMYLVIALSHQTIAVSDAVAKKIPRIFKKKIVVIKNGVACSGPLERERARELLGEYCPELKTVSKDALWIGTIAELHPVKGLEYAIEALQKVSINRPIVYVILGEGVLRERLEKIIEEKKLTKGIFLAGFVPDASFLLPAFDLTILPSLSEALAFVLLEAGCNARAMIASNVGGVPEVIHDGENGLLVAPAHPTLLGSAIKKLADDPELRKKLGDNLKKTVIEEFSVSKMQDSTIALYKK